MDRKDFIVKSSLVAAGLCCLGGSSLLTGCTPIHYAAHNIDDDVIALSKEEYGKNKFVIIQNDKLSGPVYLTNRSSTNGSFVALLMICTHRQCVVDPAGNILVCPCHGAEYSNDGKVLGGPTNEPLPSFKVTTDQVSIYIHTKIKA